MTTRDETTIDRAFDLNGGNDLESRVHAMHAAPHFCPWCAAPDPKIDERVVTDKSVVGRISLKCPECGYRTNNMFRSALFEKPLYRHD